jgi:elongation factor P
MSATTNEIRVGNKLEIDNQPYLVLNNEFCKPGKGQAFNRIKLKNMMTGRVVENTYKSGDKLDLADIEEFGMTFLYREDEGAVFMDQSTFDQISVGANLIKPIAHWLVEEVIYQVVVYNGNVIDVVPPFFLEMTIAETSEGVRGDSSGRVLKPAKTNTGAEIQVPIFIGEGEKIKVDTRTGEYASRVND